MRSGASCIAVKCSQRRRHAQHYYVLTRRTPASNAVDCQQKGRHGQICVLREAPRAMWIPPTPVRRAPRTSNIFQRSAKTSKHVFIHSFTFTSTPCIDLSTAHHHGEEYAKPGVSGWTAISSPFSESLGCLDHWDMDGRDVGFNVFFSSSFFSRTFSEHGWGIGWDRLFRLSLTEPELNLNELVCWVHGKGPCMGYYAETG